MVLVVNMIRSRTGVKFLRRLGITLIFLPEITTTFIGVALLLVAHSFSKRHKASLDKRLREMIQRYLINTRRFGDDADGKSSDPGSARRHNFSEERHIPEQITGSHSFQTGSSVRPGTPDMRDGMRNRAAHTQSLSRSHKHIISHSPAFIGTPKVINHTMNMEWLPRRFESANGAVAHCRWATASGAVNGTAHRSVNMHLPFQHYKTGSVAHTKAKRHTTGEAHLQQRYGSAVDFTTALNAVQSNNRYYDILSRKNVIGGY